MASFRLMNNLAKINNAKTYLEIGVKWGATFKEVSIQNKYAVDPNFMFDYASIQNDTTHFFEQTSDIFFEDLKIAHDNIDDHDLKNIIFDIVFLDGLHTFEQTWRDFINILPYTNDHTIIVFDDTIPSDPYSAIPNQKESYAFRTKAGISGMPWHGDVFKCVFALHDFHKEYSYCTHLNENPQTIVWKTGRSSPRPSLFGSLIDISHRNYFDIIRHGATFVPVTQYEALELVGLELDPEKYTEDNYSFLIKELPKDLSSFYKNFWIVCIANIKLDNRVYANADLSKRYVQFLIVGMPKWLHYELVYSNNFCEIRLDCENVNAIIRAVDTFKKLASAHGYNINQSARCLKLFKHVPIDTISSEFTSFIDQTIGTMYDLFAYAKVSSAAEKIPQKTYSRIIEKYIVKALVSKKKYKKYLENRDRFFSDSKNSFSKLFVK